MTLCDFADRGYGEDHTGAEGVVSVTELLEERGCKLAPIAEQLRDIAYSSFSTQDKRQETISSIQTLLADAQDILSSMQSIVEGCPSDFSGNGASEACN